MKRTIGVAVVLMGAMVAAHAQFAAPPPDKWPMAPGDWMEFAPGTDEKVYFEGAYHWYGDLTPDQRPGAKPNKGFDIRKDRVAKWMHELKRPDSPPNSCCGRADAYEVEIIKDGGQHGEWVAEITHGEARKYPDGTTRPPLPNGTKFHVVPEHVTKPSQSNPTMTAWIFVAVGWRTVTVYCLVPLPPSF